MKTMKKPVPGEWYKIREWIPQVGTTVKDRQGTEYTYMKGIKLFVSSGMICDPPKEWTYVSRS